MRESNNMGLSPDDEDKKALKNLKEGDKIYTASFQWNADEHKGEIDVEEFLFRKYVEPETNHTEVKLNDAITPAILYLEKSPKVDIPQDIGAGFYTTPRKAVESFKEGIDEIVVALEDWLKNNPS